MLLRKGGRAGWAREATPGAVRPGAVPPSGACSHLVLLKRDDRHGGAAGVLVKHHHAVDEGEEGVVAAQAHVLAGVHLQQGAGGRAVCVHPCIGPWEAPGCA